MQVRLEQGSEPVTLDNAILLFIDEICTVVGAGAGDGAMDAGET